MRNGGTSISALPVEETARPAKSLALSTKDVTAETGIGLNAQYDAIRTGTLKARKLGRKTIILRADLERWLASLPVLDLSNNPSTPIVRNRNPVGRRKRVGERVPT
jgi:Helix-turn-helix domain